MELVLIFAPETKKNAAFSVIFDGNELCSLGVKDGAVDYDDEYINKSEYHKIRNLWKDPLYLANFYDENKSYFEQPYWNGIDEAQFVVDVQKCALEAFKTIFSIIREGNLLELFEPLDRNSDSRRKRNRNYNVKSKYGSIGGRLALRIYGVMVGDDAICITGGAVKLVEEMHEASNTEIELNKMKKVLSFIDSAQLFDKDSFIDFIMY